MTWKIEGFNPILCEWEDMPYQTEEDGPEFTTFPVEYMAEATLAHWREFYPGVKFRLVEI